MGIVPFCVIACVLTTVLVVVGSKVNPVSGLHNMPLAIQQRVHELPEYQFKIKPILSTKERLCKKLPAAALALVVLVVVAKASGAHDFISGFAVAFILWTVVKLWVALVLDCGWLAHSPRAWIPGTEDLGAAYKDYGFWLSSIPRSLLAGAIVAALVGLLIHVLSLVL